MPFFESARVRLYYEVHGDGFPVLLLAPGGLRSAVGAWRDKPINPIEVFANDYRVIAMDQRNAGQSWAPISGTDGWHSYAADQLALLDHLGAQRFHVIGMCIGGAFITRLLKAVPERVASAVMLQPIGLEHNRAAFLALAHSWRDEVREQHPEASAEVFASLVQNMFGGDFVFSGVPADLRCCGVPLLVLLGDDLYHPAAISRQIADLAPRARLVEAWKHGEDREHAIAQLRDFLAAHTPYNTAE